MTDTDTAAADTVVGKGTAADTLVDTGTGVEGMAEDKGRVAVAGDKWGDRGTGALGMVGGRGMVVAGDIALGMGRGVGGKAGDRGTAAELEAAERLLAENQTKNIQAD